MAEEENDNGSVGEFDLGATADDIRVQEEVRKKSSKWNSKSTTH